MHYSKEKEKEIIDNLANGRKWCDKGVTPAKDKRMEMTEENFDRVIAMRDELIFEQKAEISKLKNTVNNLELKLQSKKQIIRNVSDKTNHKKRA